MEIIDILKKSISQEENTVVNALPKDNEFAQKRIIFELARAMDVFFLSSETIDPKVASLHAFGWNRALNLAYGEFTNREKYPLGPSSHESWGWVNSFIQHCSKIAICEKLITLYKAGLVDLSLVNGRDIHVHVPDVTDFEGYDRESFEWFQDLIETRITDPKIEELNKRFPDI